MFNYSIIIPHKNIPSLLRRCLDSIPERDDLEIIVVDDNSKEDTIRDLQTIHRNNLQIIYTKEGKGAGYARNVGISKAQGKWILFADADDFFLPNVIEKISPYSDCPQNLILFNSTCRFSDDLTQNGDRDKICNKFSKIQEKFSAGKIDSTHLLLDVCVPWSKMIRLNHLLKNNIFFEDVKFANDIGWSTNLALKTGNKDILISNIKLYCLTDRRESLFHTRNEDAYLCRFGVCYRQKKLLEKNNIYIPFDFSSYVIQARVMGFLFLLKFYKYILQTDFQIAPIYQIEKKLHLKKPYIYMLFQFIKALLNIPFNTIRLNKQKA